MLCQMRVAPEEFVPFGGDPFAAGSDPFIVDSNGSAPVVAPLGKNRNFTATGIIGTPLFGQARVEWEKEEKARAEAKRREDIAFRWRLAKWLRYELIRRGLYETFRSLCDCHRYPIPVTKNNCKKIPGTVQIHYYPAGFNSFDDSGDAGLGFAFVEKCANSWFCFIDAPKIRCVRRELIKKTTEAMLNRGHDLYMETFTAPHDINTDIKEFRYKFSKAKSEVTSGSKYQNVKKKYGILYSYLSNELTVDHPDARIKTGPHFHSHKIQYTKARLEKRELIELESELKVIWYNALLKYGLCTEDQKEDVLAYGYSISYDREEIENKHPDRAAEYIAKMASFELSPTLFSKKGRGENQDKERISHFQFMAIALTRNDNKLIDYGIKLMYALKGVNAIRSSKGLLKYAGTESDNKTDEEILEETSGFVVDDDIDNKVYECIDDAKLQWAVLEATKENLKNVGVDISDLPVVTEVINGKKKLVLDKTSRKYTKLRDILKKNIDLAASGIDPLTGEDARAAAYEREWVTADRE